jgi:hypothetical protein
MAHLAHPLGNLLDITAISPPLRRQRKVEGCGRGKAFGFGLSRNFVDDRLDVLGESFCV